MIFTRFACLGLLTEMFFSFSFLFAQPCLTAKPAPACRSCFITEFGYGYKITPPLKTTYIDTIGDSVASIYEWSVTGHNYLTSELGYIYNLTPKYSLGFTHFTGCDVGHDIRGGIKLRVRRWFNEKTSLDLSGGAIVWGLDSDLKQTAFVGSASLTFSDWEAINVMFEILERQPYDNTYYYDGIRYRTFSPGRRNVGVYLGSKLSSKPGLACNGAAIVATSILFMIFLSTFSGD